MAAAGKWDAEADRALLLGILKEHNITVDHAKMAEHMQAKRYSFTKSAIQNRMHRLKAGDKKGDTNSGGDADDETTPKAKTPRGRKRAVDKNAASPEESPTKKGKGRKGKVVVKEENGDDEQEGEE